MAIETKSYWNPHLYLNTAGFITTLKGHPAKETQGNRKASVQMTAGDWDIKIKLAKTNKKHKQKQENVGLKEGKVELILKMN